MDLGLKGKIAVVTGANKGIGKAIAKTLATEGSTVIINGYQRSLTEETTRELRGLNLNVEGYTADVSNEKLVKKMVNYISMKYGRLDILVNNAGIPGSGKSICDVQFEDWKKIININLSSAFFCIKHAAPVMKKNNYGRIVNISSIFAFSGGIPGIPDYVSSKAGLIGLTKNAALELGKWGITVNTVLPGFIKTDMLSYLHESELKALAKQIPVRRIGTPQDVANLVCFLVSELSSYINGAVIHIDGGRTEYVFGGRLNET